LFRHTDLPTKFRPSQRQANYHYRVQLFLFSQEAPHLKEPEPSLFYHTSQMTLSAVSWMHTCTALPKAIRPLCLCQHWKPNTELAYPSWKCLASYSSVKKHRQS